MDWVGAGILDEFKDAFAFAILDAQGDEIPPLPVTGDLPLVVQVVKVDRVRTKVVGSSGGVR